MKKELEHIINPLHIYCKMIDYLRIPDPVAYKICELYDRKVYKPLFTTCKHGKEI